MHNKQSNLWGSVIWPLALLLFFAGLILLPIHFRDPFLKTIAVVKKYSLINYLCCFSLLLLMITKRDYTIQEIGLCVLWAFLLIPVFISCRDQHISKPITAAANCVIPAYLIIQRIDQEKREKYLKIVLYVLDVFVIILFCIGLFEKINGHMLFRGLESWFHVHGYKTSEYTRFVGMLDSGVERFFSFWGHPLTNAVIFNMFFILNDIYHRSCKKKYPMLICFIIAFVGDAVLSVGKTAFVVCAIYFVLINWKQKRWLFVYILGAAAGYFSGLFNKLIERFTTSSLTSGRVDRLIEFFSGNLYPLKFFTGYGNGTTYLDEMRHLSPAFEFPILMFALDYGILFSALFVGSVFVYYSYHFLKRKEYLSWVGLTLLYAQINTYNGMSLRNQDIGWLTAFIIMIAINTITLTDHKNADDGKTKEPI